MIPVTKLEINVVLLNDGAKRNRFHICKSCIQPLEKSYICTFFGEFFSNKIDSNMCYKAPEQIPVIGIGSINNPITGSYFCTFFGEFSSNKFDSNM